MFENIEKLLVSAEWVKENHGADKIQSAKIALKDCIEQCEETFASYDGQKLAKRREVKKLRRRLDDIKTRYEAL